MKTIKQEICKKIKEIGLKNTKEREVCVDLLLKTSSHFSLKELANTAKKDNLNLSRASIYRNIPVLEEIGFIRKVNIKSGQQYYEVILNKEHHEHLFCKQCNKSIEFDDSELEGYFKKVFKKFGFTPIGHQLELWGTCINCQLNK